MKTPSSLFRWLMNIFGGLAKPKDFSSETFEELI
jgi:hypothetical protein